MKKLLLYILVLVSSYSSLVAQQVNTLYFMDNVPYRNKLNPAFQPLNNFYFGLTPIGYTGFGIGNNSLTVKDIIYKDPLDPDGPPITFLHPHGNFNNFLKAIRPNTLIGTNLDLNFLAMGFRTGNSYWNLSVAGKTSFQLMASKYISDGHWGLDFSSYLEAGLGYSRNWNDRLSIGLKAKYLWGIMQGQVNNDVKLDTSDGLKISGTTNLKLASPLELNPTDLSSIITGGQDIMTELTKPTGTGLGLDLGATWKIIPNLTLSAAVVDLGMINWTKNTRSYTATIQFDSNDVTSQLFSPNSDSIMSGILENAIGVDSTIGGSYRTYTDPKLNVGLEFGLVKDKITLGLLSRTMMHRGRMFEEVTTSLNLKPLSWFDLSTSYSLMNGRWSNVGAGLGLRLGFLHMFLGADYVPMRFVRYNTFNYVPSNTKGVNLALGFNIVFGSNKDSDKDGVPDRKDKYPGTPRHVAVDKKGRALDTDNDGVPDYQDKCPGTPPEAGGYVDSNGCPLDTDGDSIPNYKDICPDTPEAAYGRVDTTGCPADTDGDGAPDYVDKCPQTPKNAIADKNGCPLDTDSDGVADYLDKCPGTPVQARGAVDSTGCLLDSDSDSIPDYLDKCPGTPV
ncbi:MAG TPA: DUF5723 family protein, partial [Paludibacter sp.]|nr:DUF5723 family protein [Paludibacter sp.]